MVWAAVELQYIGMSYVVVPIHIENCQYYQALNLPNHMLFRYSCLILKTLLEMSTIPIFRWEKVVIYRILSTWYTFCIPCFISQSYNGNFPRIYCYIPISNRLLWLRLIVAWLSKFQSLRYFSLYFILTFFLYTKSWNYILKWERCDLSNSWE